jgi:hypothetical protein
VDDTSEPLSSGQPFSASLRQKKNARLQAQRKISFMQKESFFPFLALARFIGYFVFI